MLQYWSLITTIMALPKKIQEALLAAGEDAILASRKVDSVDIVADIEELARRFNELAEKARADLNWEDSIIRIYREANSAADGANSHADEDYDSERYKNIDRTDSFKKVLTGLGVPNDEISTHPMHSKIVVEIPRLECAVMYYVGGSAYVIYDTENLEEYEGMRRRELTECSHINRLTGRGKTDEEWQADLTRLLTCEPIFMDKDYFSNPEIVLYDFNAMVHALTDVNGVQTSILDIALNKQVMSASEVMFETYSGETMNFRVYLGYATAALSDDKINLTDANAYIKDTFNYLLALLGLHPEQYFRNPRRVQIDLDRIESVLDKKITEIKSSEITRTRPTPVFTDSTGRVISIISYLSRAGMTLLPDEIPSAVEARKSSNITKTISTLLEIAEGEVTDSHRSVEHESEAIDFLS